MPNRGELAAAFDTFNRVRLQSPLLERIWREGFGDEYAEESRPDAFYPQSALEHIIEALGPRRTGQALLDVGCGHGLTGFYLARRLGMRLMGIDISPVSIQLARQNIDHAASELNFRMNPEFWIADASDIGLPDGACGGVVCLDVMLYFPDKSATIREVARVLAPGGIFAFTTWEQSGFNPRLGAQQVQDFRPLLQQAGFSIVHYDLVDRSVELQTRVMQGLIANEDALRNEVGEQAASMLASMARSALRESSGRRYVLGIAQRQA